MLFEEKTTIIVPLGEYLQIASMYQDFLKIRDQEDPYRYKYMSGPPDTVAYADALQSKR